MKADKKNQAEFQTKKVETSIKLIKILFDKKNNFGQCGDVLSEKEKREHISQLPQKRHAFLSKAPQQKGEKY